MPLVHAFDCGDAQTSLHTQLYRETMCFKTAAATEHSANTAPVHFCTSLYISTRHCSPM